MKCKWCAGTGNRTGTSGCEHCGNSGVQVDPPFGQKDDPPEVLADQKVHDLCNRLFAMNRSNNTAYKTGYDALYESKLKLLDQMAFMLCGEALSADDKEELARFWADPTCNDTYGDIFQRVASRILYAI